MAAAMGNTEDRLKQLDAAGLTVQVLSYPMAGAGSAAATGGFAMGERCKRSYCRPHRCSSQPLRGACSPSPLTDPDASADELERTITQLGFSGALVSGATDGRYLDHQSFEPLLARAEKLDVPIYLHPAASRKPAREALYGGLPDDLGMPRLDQRIAKLSPRQRMAMPIAC
jgi:predicted TIM-barrel fold metal-dependent hydrolase